MPGLFYYRHYIGDYDTLTKDLTMLEHGAYRKLLDGYYGSKGALLATEEKLFRVAGAFTEAEQVAVRSVVAQYFTVHDGFLVHGRANEEIARVLRESESQSAKARKKWDKQADLASQNAPADAAERPPAKAAAKPRGRARAMPVNSQDSKSNTPLNPPLLAFPDWLPVNTWNDYLEMRKKLKKPATDRAIELLLNKLDAMRQGGNDPKKVLEQSIENSWQGIFPLRNENGGRRSHTEHANDQSAAEWADS